MFMKNAASESPFAVQIRQEQQAQWLLWQRCSGPETEAELHRLVPEDTMPAPQDRAAVQTVQLPAIQRSRYNAVVKRMQQATQQTGVYSAWS